MCAEVLVSRCGNFILQRLSSSLGTVEVLLQVRMCETETVEFCAGFVLCSNVQLAQESWFKAGVEVFEKGVLGLCVLNHCPHGHFAEKMSSPS